MNVSRALTTVALSTLLSCGSTSSNGGVGPSGLPGPEGPAGPAGDPGETGQTGPTGPSTSDIVLPGTSYYPESLTALANGTLFIGSFETGQIYKFTPGAQIPTVFVGAAAGIKNVTGVLADEAGATLYACAVDRMAMPFTSAVKSFNLADGTVKQTYAFPSTGAAGACNDLTLDTAGNLFVSDSFGIIYKLPAGGAALASWAADVLLEPSAATDFGADGIVFDGTSNFFVNNISKGTIIRIPVKADGTADTMDEIVVTPALTRPDGMRRLDATTLLVIEGGDATHRGSLTKLVINNAAKTAAGTIINNRLDSPTSVVKVGMTYWITEGQIPQLFSGTPMPNLPFLVRRVPSFE